MNIKTLYRPVGIKELALIADSDWKRFPPRLEWQPIFYPVLNEEYAIQIARDWNTNDPFSGYCGIVTTFNLNKDHYKKYAVQNVGGEIHNELWIPAEELKEFNENICGTISIGKVFFGESYTIPQHKGIAAILSDLRATE